jgi:hypothetical protein
MTLRAVSASVSAPPPTRSSAKAGKSDAELAIVAQLAVTDRHVSAHEEAHLAAAGPYATGGPTYIYQQGPDGKLYAVGGEVTLDDSPVSGDPAATVEKEKTVIAAADAPAIPHPRTAPWPRPRRWKQPLSRNCGNSRVSRDKLKLIPPAGRLPPPLTALFPISRRVAA